MASLLIGWGGQTAEDCPSRHLLRLSSPAHTLLYDNRAVLIEQFGKMVPVEVPQLPFKENPLILPS